MRILIIGKYPPIEGGTMSATYWLARGLGEAGATVTVVTNADRVEEKYRIPLNLKDHATQHNYMPENVLVRSLEKEPPAHIPFSESFVSRLANLGLRAVAERGADVVYAHYLEPYGVAALMVKQFTGIPFAIRHAGSDIYRLLRSEDLSLVLGRTLQNADLLFMSSSLRRLTRRLRIPRYKVAPIVRRALPPQFSPEGEKFAFPSEWQRPKGVPLIVYFGKTARNKGIMEMLEVIATMKQDVRLLMVTNGNMLEQVKKRVAEDEQLQKRVWFSDFVAPWVVPQILRSADVLMQLENKFPIPIHTPTQPHEGVACGVPLLLSEEMAAKLERIYPRIREQATVIPDPTDVPVLSQKLEELVSDIPGARTRARELHKEFEEHNDWDGHIADYLKLFKGIRRRNLIGRFLPNRL